MERSNFISTINTMPGTRRTSKRAAAVNSSNNEDKPKPIKKRKDTATTEKKPRKSAKEKITNLPKSSSNDDEPWYTVFTKGDKQYNDYMANEWAYETHGDNALFERLCLEGAQSGLSWLTILRKREAYRSIFHHFDPNLVARMDDSDVQRIIEMEDDDKTNLVVRHRGKVEAVVQNAKCLLKLQKENGSKNALDTLLWGMVDNKPILNCYPNNLSDFATQTDVSVAMSKDLKKRGFKFVGPTTCYALMQAVGMVVDHPIGTPEWNAAKKRLEERKGGYQRGAHWPEVEEK